jgi:hypothetical protein
MDAQPGRMAFQARSFPAIWTTPYFDAAAGNINMTTFSVAFGTDDGKFLGVCTMDVAVESLCWKNCSDRPALPTTLNATMTSTQTLMVLMRKPATEPVTVLMTLQATGDRTIHTSYNASMELRKHTPFVGSWAAWSSVDTEQMVLAGHRMRWLDTSPSTDSDIILGTASNVFAATRQYSLQLDYVDCAGKRPCIEDGDTIETVIAIGSSLDAQSEVRIMTQVEALLSCNRTRIEGIVERVPVSSTFIVRLFALDIDGLQINQTRVEISLAFGDQSITWQWSRGSNEYTATVPAELTLLAGHYNLEVRASNAWNETPGPHNSTCVLFSRAIEVVQGSNVQIIVVGTIAGFLVFSLLLLMIYLVRSHKEKSRRVLIAFMKHEGVLAAKVAVESCVRALALALRSSSARTPLRC